MDNRSHEEAEWDMELLAPELEELLGLDMDLIFGYGRRKLPQDFSVCGPTQ